MRYQMNAPGHEQEGKLRIWEPRVQSALWGPLWSNLQVTETGSPQKQNKRDAKKTKSVATT